MTGKATVTRGPAPWSRPDGPSDGGSFLGVMLAVFLVYANIPVVAADQGWIPTEAAALVALFFLPALGHHLVVRGERLRLDRTFALMTAFLAVMLVSACFARDVPLALAHIGGYAAEGLVLFVLVLNTVRDRPALVRLLWTVLGAATFLSLLTLYQEITRDDTREFGGLASRQLEHLEDAPVREADRAEGMRLEQRSHGPMNDANRYAQILLVAASFALAFVWTYRGRPRAVAGAAGLAILAGLLLTYSRGAFLTLVLLVLLLGALRYVSRKRLAVALLVGTLLVPLVAPAYMDRVHTIAGAMGLVTTDAEVEPDGPTRGRTTQMLAAGLAFADHPVLGVGPGHYAPHYSVRYQQRPEIAFRELDEPRRAHNLYLEMAAETGTVGLAIFLAIPGLLLRELWRIRRRARGIRPEVERMAMGFILAILSYLGTGVFLHLAFQRYYWLLVGLSAAAVHVLHRELAQNRRTPSPTPRVGEPRATADGSGPGGRPSAPSILAPTGSRQEGA